MIRQIVILAVFGAAAAAACAQTGANPQAAPTAGNCQAFTEALRGCAPASCDQRHPFAPGFTITHRVTGTDGEHCAYTQSMPDDMSMSCSFTPAGREEMAGLIEDMGRGNFSGGTGQQNAMTRECVVRDGSGTPIPWG
jgi:hypothetical protein